MAAFIFLQIDPELEKRLKMNKVSLESEYEVRYASVAIFLVSDWFYLP